MEDIFTRTKMLIGEEGCKRLSSSHIAIFGLGGVGSAATEALVRAGIGELTLVDGDEFSPSNLNRQLYATKNSIGKRKTDIAKERINSINENCVVHTFPIFYLPPSDEIDYSSFTYVLDAIDTVTAKLYIAEKCDKYNIPHISCMGSGNKLDPFSFEVADIFSTSTCPLARVMRKECKKHGIEKLKVIYSKEETIKTETRTPGSISFVPPVMGFLASSVIIREILNI